ncbi:MAG: succinylglutamate desuccinylase/aspartoacylase family protein [Bryobacterales bacterium]|nr:succinylglutamate desuccinylase/aspartoacylase family protein [Bryobacterales bacterium]
MRVLLPLLFFATSAAAQAPFVLAGESVPPGTTRSFLAGVAGTRVPITVIHGVRKGPVLTLTGGIHGDEFPSILALQRVRTQVCAADLAGVLVLVHVANLGSFHSGALTALNPADGKNLNRVFPGSATGTPTERLAHFLTTEIVERTNYLIDMHSGSAGQQLWPHVYSPFVGDEELDRRTLEFARATGMGHIVLYGDRPRDPARSISYPNTAMTRGKPGLTVEIGDLGRRDESDIMAYLGVVRRAMQHLGMIPGTPPANDGAILYRKLWEVESPADGTLHPKVRIGDLVGKGALLAEVTDYFGDKAGELRAPVQGIVLMLGHAPAVTKGRAPVTIGEW